MFVMRLRRFMLSRSHPTDGSQHCMPQSASSNQLQPFCQKLGLLLGVRAR
jgi:hypothetical protein